MLDRFNCGIDALFIVPLAERAGTEQTSVAGGGAKISSSTAKQQKQQQLRFKRISVQETLEKKMLDLPCSASDEANFLAVPPPLPYRMLL